MRPGPKWSVACSSRREKTMIRAVRTQMRIHRREVTAWVQTSSTVQAQLITTTQRRTRDGGLIVDHSRPRMKFRSLLPRRFRERICFPRSKRRRKTIQAPIMVTHTTTVNLFSMCRTPYSSKSTRPIAWRIGQKCRPCFGMSKEIIIEPLSDLKRPKRALQISYQVSSSTEMPSSTQS